ncbi:antibiotic biosynthesis monooxygenase family protein [Ktedonosporobacter rubrisoli]|nr:antibiotic biosynthesis monooxygenase [Ktedonosporobacter rubrisoli]
MVKIMELLVVTLAYTHPGRDADVTARVRQVIDTIRNAPGLVTSRNYRNRGKETYYFLLTTWEDEESWHRAQERYNPKNLLLTSVAEALTAVPEQWLMRYIWGYSRPAATPSIAAAHLTNVLPEQVEFAQRGWIEGLRRQAAQPMLAFAFLARGLTETTITTSDPAAPNAPSTLHTSYHDSPLLLNLFNWSSEAERTHFYADPNYQAVSKFVESIGAVSILPLEPIS